MSEPLIAIQALTKSFGKQAVLQGVDLEVPRGAVFGFLGLNGAGKSTTIKILLGLLKPNGGSVSVVGTDPTQDSVLTRQRVGYMAENQTMYPWMRVNELIGWSKCFYSVWDDTLVSELLERMHLDPKAKVGTLSKGQSSKLALLLALAHQPELVILDDPVLGLDPLARRDLLRDVIALLQARHVTVFFSSHLLYEIEPICDRVAILHEGKILTSAAVDALRERVRRFEFAPQEQVELTNIPGLLHVQREGQRIVLVSDGGADAESAIRAISRNGITPSDLNLDEIFEAYVAGRKEVLA